LVVRLGPEIGLVRVDPGQIEQVILNLVINARDASEPGSKVWISTREEQLELPRSAYPQPVRAGHWVVLEVSDKGTGMEHRVLSHIFEPFYTTKGVGKGTGLGLSTVLGIVQQSEGVVTVDSRVGAGTTFEVWLPRLPGPAASSKARHVAEDSEPTLARGRETVLVIEDEAPVRRTVQQILQMSGYDVLIAEDGAAGLELCRARGDDIDLVLTDFVMPRLGGIELITKLRAVNSQVKILLMSGFSDGQVSPDKLAELGGVATIEKPFRAAALLDRVRELLGT
jgi:CheY-like chemotaxis protein